MGVEGDMAGEHLGALLRLLRRQAGDVVGGALSDGQLLERFVGQHDQAAFEALFWRHGPMVLAVCRRLLGPADAEDAFQATFLVLVRKAASIGRRDAVGAWLYRVAYRVALRARATARPAVELPPEGPPAPDEEAAAWRDLRPLLDAAIAGLPEKYRAPVVLCYLEGRTNEEAARELGCPKGTVAVRLMRARERLRRRLERCRLILPAALLAALLAGRARAEAVEAALAATTMKAALGAAAGGTLSAAASANAAALAQGVMRAMYLRKMKWTVAVVVALGVIVGGGVWWQQHAAQAAPAGKEQPAKPAPGPAAPAGAREDPAGKPATDKEERRDLVEAASPRDGIVHFVGTEITLKPGEKAPAGAFQAETAYLVIESGAGDEKSDDWVVINGKWYRPLAKREEMLPNKVRLHRAQKWFLPLKEGDKVKPGQLLAMTDAELAADEVAIKLAKFDTAEAERAAEEKQRDEYKERQQRAYDLYKRGAGSYEDYTAAKLAYEYHVFDTVQKQQELKVAERELRKARTELGMHEVRSKVSGVVTRIERRAGEGVKGLDPVVRVRLEEK
jgi:RNA polymerase sigma factor (sigma-70 family)